MVLFCTRSKDLNHIGHAFHRAEVRKVNENLFILGCKFAFRQLPSAGWNTSQLTKFGIISMAVESRVHLGDVTQIVRNRGDAIAFLNGELGDGQVGTIFSHQCDVCPM